jgi:hypothetical protein
MKKLKKACWANSFFLLISGFEKPPILIQEVLRFG